MRSPFPVHLADINRFDVDLMNKRRGLERMPFAFPWRRNRQTIRRNSL